MDKIKNVFIAYEYLNINVKHEHTSQMADCYKYFGWQIVDVRKEDYMKTNLQFKRNKDIANRNELNVLQEKFEQKFEQILNLEDSKTIIPVLTAIVCAVIGVVFIISAFFCYLGNHTAITFVLAIMGMITCGLSLTVYDKVKKRRTIKINARIEEIYNALCDICEDANGYSYETAVQ